MAIFTYRHRLTGSVGDYPEELAAQFPDLVKVEPGSKPLGITPIPQSEVDAVLEKQAAEKDAPKTEEK